MRRLLLLAFAILVLAPAAQGTPPGRNGSIVYLRLERQDNPLWGGLWVTRPDGSGTHRLTHPPNGTVDGTPDWSPDGRRLVFLGKHMTSRTNGTGCECRSLWVVDADGAHLHRIRAPGLRPADFESEADRGTR
jgi:Tol biopolymer transport system component